MNVTRNNITRNMMTRPATAAAAALLALGAAGGAQAQTWAKTGSPGNLPATAQVTFGLGGLQEITGAFSYTTAGTERNTVNISSPDLFEIFIDGSAPFSATTLGEPSTLYDPQLFLFDSAGAGVYANDDASDFTRGALIAPATALAPGLYFLGIATYGVVPRSGTGAGSDMFDNPVDDTSGAVGFTGLKGPKAGATGPLTNWFLSGADVETGTYGIALTGASYAAPPAPVPEAPTGASLGLLLLLGLGGPAVAAKRRKAGAKTAPSS